MRYMISLSDEIIEKLDEVAEKTGNTRSGVIHIALLEFLERYSAFFGLDLSAYSKKIRAPLSWVLNEASVPSYRRIRRKYLN